MQHTEKRDNQIIKTSGIFFLILCLSGFIKIHLSKFIPPTYLAICAFYISLVQILVIFIAFILLVYLYLNSKWWLYVSVATLILCEVLCCIAIRNVDLIPQILFKNFYHYYPNCRNIIQYSEPCACYNPNLYYTLRPNSSCNFKNWEFSTTIFSNSKGLRDDESSLEKPEIICLGDSHTMGWGCEQDQTYPQVLEQRLKRKVLNAGISSYGTAREIMLIKTLDTSNLKYLIFQYCQNDYDENKEYIENNFKLKISSNKSYTELNKLTVLRNVYFPFKHFLGICYSAGLALKIRLTKPSVKITETVKSDKQTEAKAFFEVLQRAKLPPNVKILVFYQKIVGQPDSLRTSFYAALKQLVSTSKYAYSLESIDIAHDRQDFFRIDDHTNTSGNQRTAVALARHIH